jgi:hypothetical protein
VNTSSVRLSTSAPKWATRLQIAAWSAALKGVATEVTCSYISKLLLLCLGSEELDEQQTGSASSLGSLLPYQRDGQAAAPLGSAAERLDHLLPGLLGLLASLPQACGDTLHFEGIVCEPPQLCRQHIH